MIRNSRGMPSARIRNLPPSRPNATSAHTRMMTAPIMGSMLRPRLTTVLADPQNSRVFVNNQYRLYDSTSPGSPRRRRPGRLGGPSDARQGRFGGAPDGTV